MASPPHICYVSLSYPSPAGGSGVANQVWLLAHAAAREGHRVSVVTLARTDEPLAECEGGITYHYIQRGNKHWLISRLPIVGPKLSLGVRELEDGWKVYRAVRRVHQAHAVDLIEGTETACSVLAYALPSIPLLIRLHGERFTWECYIPGGPLSSGVRLARMAQRPALRKAVQLVAPSCSHARAVLTELGSRHPPIRIIPNIVEMPGVPRGHDEPNTVAPGGMILFAGRIEVGKGIFTLLEAAPRLFARCPKAQIVIVGEKHPSLEVDRFQRLLIEASRAGRVDVLGAVSATDLAAMYSRASVCVVPSFYESFGLAAFEPALFGTPVVASQVAALEELLDDDVTAFLCPPGDSRALADALVRVLSDGAARVRVATHARALVSERFSPERVIPLNLELYRSITPHMTPVDASMQHIFFSPHPDDVPWSCGGLVAKLTQQGEDTSVVTVFGRQDSGVSDFAFARHLAASWGVSDDSTRLREDREAMKELGVSEWDSWEFPEAPARADADGMPLYSTYDELWGTLAALDEQTVVAIQDRVRTVLHSSTRCRAYMPLAVGMHVDHQLLYRVGSQLAREGADVWFYEDWPYVEKSSISPDTRAWVEEVVPIPIDVKLRAAQKYRSQLGESQENADRHALRLRTWNQPKGAAQARERFWHLRQPADMDRVHSPFVPHEGFPALHFRRYLRTLRPHDTGELLSPGSGICAISNCDADLCTRVERLGYTCTSLDPLPQTHAASSTSRSLPYSDATIAALILLRVIAQSDELHLVVTEAARVLEAGGMVCGALSCVRSKRGGTFLSQSPLLLEESLTAAGFADIRFSAGLNRYSAFAWTSLHRAFGPRAANAGLWVTAGWLTPLMAVRYGIDVFKERLGSTHDRDPSWSRFGLPLDLMGNIQFSARKAARTPPRISHS